MRKCEVPLNCAVDAAGGCWGRVGELARLLAVAVGRCGGRLARVTADDRPCKLDVDQAAVEAESQRKWHGKQRVSWARE
jgi:hypothetical protein